MTSFRRFSQPIDRIAISLMLVLALVITGIVLKGDRTAPQIRDFTWQDRQVGAEDTAFLLNFNRPMDHASVEQNLRIEPPLPGKFSWAGRRMAYTLESPAPYGKPFTLSLQGAHDRFSSASDRRTQIQPYRGQFRTRDRAFVYLGAEGAEAGRLVLQNLTAQQQAVLTPENLVVMDFKPYPEGDRILFSAIERTTEVGGLLEQQLYSVTTGIQNEAPADLLGAASSPAPARPAAAAGKVERVLDNKDYQNLKFDLSPDGKTIVVQRVSRQNPSDFGIWILQPNQPPKPVKTDPGGDFLITPDSDALAMAQGQGMAILPLAETAEPLDFLPKFGMVLTFARDGSAAAMVKFNTDPNNPTRSLFLVNNQGTDKELLKTDGSILSAQFDPAKQNLYCLITRRIPGDVYQEQPYLTAIHLPTAEVTDLLQLPIQRDVQMALAPDGLAILFDQVIDAPNNQQQGAVRGSEGKAIASSNLWIVPVLQDSKGVAQPADPQELGLKGLRPRWLP
ncbi:hypothetical protein IFO70_08445 [Phormidium tenue FACHB-886]|nr:hypothetical protein [Phormidium tenue FACHB-886]